MSRVGGGDGAVVRGRDGDERGAGRDPDGDAASGVPTGAGDPPPTTATGTPSVGVTGGDTAAAAAATAAAATDSEHSDSGTAAAGGRTERGGTEVAASETAPAAGAATPAGEPRRALAVAGVTAVVAVPLVVAAVAVRTPRWYPLVDLSQIEMRVRDVGVDHPPLVGLGGRIFGLDTQGSHPGPIGFYLLAPVYRLLGSSSWALLASAVTLNIAVVATTVWAGHRRLGLRGALLVGAGLALAMRMYGTTVLVYPWNPYMPVLFWGLLLVCLWGLLCDDVALLPVAVVAGTVCAQTHLPYVGLVGGLGVLGLGALALGWYRARGDRAAHRRILRWSVGAAALGVLLWVPVIVEQAGGDPGNLSVIVDSVRHPTDQPVGTATAWRLLTQHLDVVKLVEGDRLEPGSQVPGVALLVVWAGAALAAWRPGHRVLARLHVVVAAALVLGLVTISRIFGQTWFYLTLWAFGTASLMLVATAATAGALVIRTVATRDPHARDRLGRLSLAALATAVVVPTALLTRVAPDTEDADASVSASLAQVVQPTVDALEDGSVPPGAGEGTYYMTWVDPVNLGGQGIGLMLELERRGYDVAAPDEVRLSVRDHRVGTPEEADAQIHLAAGLPAIDRAREHPGARQVAFHDPRTDEQTSRYDGLRRQVIETLEAEGLGDLVPQVDDNLFGLAADDRLPEELIRPIYIMGTTPQPVAVFTWDPTP